MQMSLRQMLLRSGFVRREDGVVAIEAMVMMPLMFLTFMALFVTFDAYRQYAVHQKAAYVVSDMISRETMPINSAYINGTHQIFDTLTQREQTSRAQTRRAKRKKGKSAPQIWVSRRRLRRHGLPAW